MPPMPDYQPLLAFAAELADLARPLALQHFRTAVPTEQKPDHTPVTLADRAIETALRRRIEARFPAHGIHGEEHGSHGLDREFVWVLDPIDGTKSFASGNPLFGTLIGLLHQGVPVVGMLDAPALGERWAAAAGVGATHQGRPIQVRGPRRLGEAVLLCTTSDQLPADPRWRTLRQQVAWCCHGGDCCAYGFLALGHADLIVDRDLELHDWCALVPIVQQAGGVMLDWRGQPLRPGSDGAVVAATSQPLAEAALAALAAD